MPRALAFVVFLSLLIIIGLFSNQTSDGSSKGIRDQAKEGCFCHGLDPSSAVVPELITPTEGYIAGQTYNLTVSFSGGPDPKTGEARGGFYLTIDQGTLLAGDGVAVTADGKGANHTGAGNGQRSWNLQWRAAEAKTTKFTLRVNSVNGDGDSTGDMWNMVTLSLNDDGSTTSKAADTGWVAPENMRLLVVAGTLAFLVMATFLGARPTRRGRRGR